VTRREGPRFIDELGLRDRYINAGHIAGRFSRPLWDVLAKLRDMEGWVDGWNGFAAKAPTQASIEKARAWILQMHSEIANSGERWLDPFVTADVDGEVLFEWRTKTKDLSIYVDENETTYIKDLGPEVGSEMTDGDASTPRARRELWAWFTE
jgi:hypothetical protein